ncbi:hypothetical protein PI125_g25928 [Phytophthora idaei]|nr:hypothetical protein PI125_g25928 [Phytophthora idaei]
MSPADEAMDASNTRAHEDEKPRRVLRNLSFTEGRERAQAAKAVVEQYKHTKKRHVFRSPRREALETGSGPYQNLFGSDSEEEEGGVSTSPRRSRTISTGSRRTSKLPSECGGVLRRGPTRQVMTARLLTKEERHTRDGIGLQSPAPVLSTTWSSSLLFAGSLEDTPPRARTSAHWYSGTRSSRRTSRLPGACFSHRTKFL